MNIDGLLDGGVGEGMQRCPRLMTAHCRKMDFKSNVLNDVGDGVAAKVSTGWVVDGLGETFGNEAGL